MLYPQGLAYDALHLLGRAYELSPEPKYPGIIYSLACAYGMMDRMETRARILNELVSQDTLMVAAFRDLYWYEIARKNDSLAKSYRGKVERLMPWYIPFADSVARQLATETQ